MTGIGGFVFPLGKDLMDDPAKTRFLEDPYMATPADAQSMRDIAGVAPSGQDGKAATPPSDQVDIPEERQETFILGYFRARGLEALSFNEKETENLTNIFKPASPGSATQSGSGVSSEAKKIIDADRSQLKLYSELLEQEVKVEAFLSFLRICEERGEFPPFYPVYVKPQKGQVAAISAVIRARQADIQQRKTGMLSTSPVLAQTVGLPDPKSRFQEAERVRVNLVENIEIPKVRGTSYGNVQNSDLAQPVNAKNDEAIREQFMKKLDAVRKAIRDTRSEMLGDSDFLLEMEGLRLLVLHDLKGLMGKNVGLHSKLADLLRSHAINQRPARRPWWCRSPTFA